MAQFCAICERVSDQEGRCIDALAMLRGKTSYAPIDQACGTRANVDYGTMAARRCATCRPDVATPTQYDRYRRERASFPAKYAAYSSLIAHGWVVAVIAPRPGAMGGRVVTIGAFPRGSTPPLRLTMQGPGGFRSGWRHGF